MAKNWAIAIGINQYELLPQTAHLRYAVRDAELMGEFLHHIAGFPAENILLCTDASPAIGRLSTHPSRSILRRILREELQRAQGADNLWFFFAGHGMAGRNGDYFLPLDGNPNDLEDTAVSVYFVTECLRQCEAKNVVLVLDMCRNEGRMDSRDISVNVGEQTIELTKQQGMITMFSCSRGERSYEIPELQQGAFTYCLVNGLKQHTILRQLEQYLMQEVPKLRQRYNRQIPVPRIIPEPGWKYDAPLLPGYATQSDVGLLRQQAIEAELHEEFEQARQLWWQVVDAGSSAERAQAREALDRIRLKENRAQMPSPMHSPAPVPPPTPPSQRTTKQPVTSPPSSPEKPDSQKVAPTNPRTASPPPQPSPRMPAVAPRTGIPSSSSSTSTPRSRREVLKWAGLGGGGLILSIAAGQLFGNPSNDPPPLTEETSASSEPLMPVEQTSLPVETSPTSLHTLELPSTVKVDDRGEVVEEIPVTASVYDEDLGNGVRLRMVSIPEGTFVMGSPEDEPERDEDEGPQREVTVPPFFMGMFTVTQTQYEAVVGTNPATRFDSDRFISPNKPVINVSWEDAIAFCQKLSEQTGREYRLPSEAEWEYACRANTTTPFHFGETITTDLVNYNGDYTYGSAPKGIYREQTTEVGSFPANAFGLFDMHGNVWEWCQDHWHENYQGAPTDGSAWIEGGDSDRRLLRGGSWYSDPSYCRSAYRSRYSADLRLNLIGFRLVCSSPRTLS